MNLTASQSRIVVELLFNREARIVWRQKGEGHEFHVCSFVNKKNRNFGVTEADVLELERQGLVEKSEDGNGHAHYDAGAGSICRGFWKPTKKCEQTFALKGR